MVKEADMEEINTMVQDIKKAFSVGDDITSDEGFESLDGENNKQDGE
jgi:hypothetical protein